MAQCRCRKRAALTSVHSHAYAFAHSQDGTSVHCVMRMVWEKEGVPAIVQSHTLNLLADGIRETVAHVHSDWVCGTLIQLAHRWRRAGRASPTGTRSAHQAIHKRRSLSHAVQKNATIPLCVKTCVYV